jgi:predicted RNA-binding protein YlqC (UPF0109 family)
MKGVRMSDLKADEAKIEEIRAAFQTIAQHMIEQGTAKVTIERGEKETDKVFVIDVPFKQVGRIVGRHGNIIRSWRTIAKMLQYNFNEINFFVEVNEGRDHRQR